MVVNNLYFLSSLEGAGKKKKKQRDGSVILGEEVEEIQDVGCERTLEVVWSVLHGIWES